MRFAVFLDVDGVLNTRTTCQHTPDGYTGIDDARVEILANSIKMYNCYEVILISDWKEMREYDDDYLYLLEKLDSYGLDISGKTKDQGNNRGEGILNYLKVHPEIDDYVILDDHKFDFMNYTKLWERLLITDGIERAEFASRTPEVEEMFGSIYRKYGDKVEILTGIPKPKRNITTASEDKTDWVHRLLGTEIKVNTVLREEKKNYCTGVDCILIDDLEKNISEWEAYGGTGILFSNASDMLSMFEVRVGSL